MTALKQPNNNQLISIHASTAVMYSLLAFLEITDLSILL